MVMIIMLMKVFMELLFWKTSRDAMEIVDGYGMQATTAKQNSFWSGEDEEKLTNVFPQVKKVMMMMTIMKVTNVSQQVKEMEAREPSDDMLGTIVTMFERDGCSRRQVGNKLRELGFISSITRKPLNARNMPWTEEEVDKVRRIYFTNAAYLLQMFLSYFVGLGL